MKMRGASPIASLNSLRDTLTFFECRGLEKRIHLGLSCKVNGRASCSVVQGKALVQKSLSPGNSTHRRARRGRAEEGCGRFGLVRVASRKPSRPEAVGGDESQVRVCDGEEAGDIILEDWAQLEASEAKVSEGSGRQGVDAVEVTVEKTGSNMRKIIAKISIRASLEDVWAILTDYERLADFIPGLAVSELLERRNNGCRLYQVGEQDLALGVKFKAKAVVDCEEKPCEVERNLVRRDIDFNTVEGDFQIFKGIWRMEQLRVTMPSTIQKLLQESHQSLLTDITSDRQIDQIAFSYTRQYHPCRNLTDSRDLASPEKVSGPSTFVPGTVGGMQERKTFLYYILEVQPKIWLPVALVEGRLTSEIKINLVCIRDRAQKGGTL